jgi:preprotein translocase subunit YajC
MDILMSIGSWLGQNWMLLLLLVLAVAMIVPTYLKQKKEMNNRQELSNSIKKGVKIVTTAGVYGVVESVEDTTDGKVVTIVTGSSKNPCTMTIHINAIMGIDNKTKVSDKEEKVLEVEDAEVEEVNEVVAEEDVEEKKPAKKTTSKKSK